MKSQKWLEAIRKAGRARRGIPRPDHSLRMKRKWADDEDYQRRMKTKAARHSRLMKKHWKDSEVAERRTYALNRPTVKAKISEKHKKLWSKKWYKKRMTKIRREQGKRPETKKKLSDRMKKLWADPVWKAKMCRIRKTQSKGNQIRTPNASFYRKMYDGVNGKFWMRSGWEVAFALWMDRCGVRWEYESKRFCLGNGRYYTPDFYLVDQNTHVELKGWLTKAGKQKIAKFQKLYPDVKYYLFFGEHLQKEKILQFPVRKAA